MPIQYLNRLRSDLIDAGVPVVSINAAGVVVPSSAQAAAQPIIAAFVDSPAAQLAWETLNIRTAAQDAIDDDVSAALKIARAEVAVLVDEVNNLRQWIESFKSATAAATTLADFKTRVASLASLPDRTLAQAKAAVKAKIAAGTVD